jgi:hypothetical protein
LRDNFHFIYILNKNCLNSSPVELNANSICTTLDKIEICKKHHRKTRSIKEINPTSMKFFNSLFIIAANVLFASARPGRWQQGQMQAVGGRQQARAHFGRASPRQIQSMLRQ